MMTETAQHWHQQLNASRQELLAVLRPLPPEQWDVLVYDGDVPQNVHMLVSHLIDSERGMSIQVHKTRKGQETIPENFDIHRWNATVRERIGPRTPEELFALLESTRAKTLEVLASIKPEEWSLQGRHPRLGLITIEQYYETICDHERAHAQDIQHALQANSAAVGQEN